MLAEGEMERRKQQIMRDGEVRKGLIRALGFTRN